MSFVLGLHLSPRTNGNSAILLDEFLKGVEEAGQHTRLVNVIDLDMKGCIGCAACDNTGECIINDDMQGVYPLLSKARRVVIATPIYFYGPPAQGKALIDRSQAMWARHYIKKSAEPAKPGAKGFLISVGATSGEELFRPMELCAKYFFDAIGFPTVYDTLEFRKIDESGAIRKHPTALKDAFTAGFNFASF